MSDLKKQTLKGIAFLGAGKSAGRILSFINTLILARILSPEDYGLMAMAMVISGFISFFNDIGLGSAIIQRKEVSKEQLSGAFYIALMISIFLYILTFFLSSSASDFYENPQVEPILQVIAIGFIFGAIKTVPNALLLKEMSFKSISGIEFISIVVQCAVTLLLAYIGYGVWSLVYGLLVTQLFKAIAMMWLSGWLPDTNGSIKQATELMKFGLSVTYSRVTWYLYINSQILVLGKVVGEKQTGIFSMAQTIADLPTAHITNLIIQVASPLFAKLQDDFNALNNALLKLTAGLSLISFPVLFGIIITANELVPILLGDNWVAVAIPLQFLCVMGLFKSIDPLLTQALISIGRADITARYTTLCAIIIPCAVIYGATWNGINGASLLLAVTYPFLMFALILISSKYFSLPIKSYLNQMFTPISGCFFMWASIYAIETIIPVFIKEVELYLLVIKVITGVISYGFWIVYIRKDGISIFKSVLFDLGVPENKLDRWPFNVSRSNA
ncbi:lipopolysaccharide biosynthesis protein [Vibrio sp. Of7-15]|uniref:lipopolysaccharide biosynthesis protein n=1 Tax=Vibrio sp. Of7-15 TaxID=2724879 RepID=UPI001EF3C760|nr:lipopolysaccharide biosynthesis protein [Vibrio sp. Of7-15]MCG7495333.1 lipopolysaccharide biosynthesis protein [Vibrio sp. Of7-15]